MAIQSWYIEGPRSHTITVQIGWLLGNARISVDGETIWRRRVAWLSNALEYVFELEGRQVAVRCNNPFGRKAELRLDGRPR
ncbi:MAG: hypothetical protein R6U89_10765 [Dehalococcoidia bacterium]